MLVHEVYMFVNRGLNYLSKIKKKNWKSQRFKVVKKNYDTNITRKLFFMDLIWKRKSDKKRSYFYIRKIHQGLSRKSMRMIREKINKKWVKGIFSFLAWKQK